MSTLDLTGTDRTGTAAADLDRIAAYFESAETVDRSALTIGDKLIVTTLNSVYVLECIGDGRWSATGGWFDRNGISPAIVRITGCSLGGSVINQRLIAGSGLRIEFDNRVVTTTIRRFTVRRLEDSVPN